MTHEDASQRKGSSGLRGFSRRKFVQSVGVAGATAGLAGCTTGNGDDEDLEYGDGTGTVQLDLGGTVQDGEEELEEALYEAGLSEDIEIDLINTSGVSDDVEAQFREWLSAGRSEPDVLRMDNGWLQAFIVREQVLNLEEELSEDAVEKVHNDYYEAAVESAADDDGELYGVPFQFDVPVMLYRKDLIEEAGYDPEGEDWATEPMSWGEFSEIVADVWDQNDDVDYGLTTQLDEFEGLACCTFNEYMSSMGGAYFGGIDNLFGPVNDRPITVTDDQVIESLEMIRTLVFGDEEDDTTDGYEQIIPEEALSWDEGPSISEFENGNAVAVRWWPSAIVTQGEQYGDDLGVMPLPYGIPEDESEYDGLGGSASALGGWALTVNPNSENIDAALEVIETIMEPEVRYALLEIGTIPPEPDLLEPDAVEPYDPVFAEHTEPFNISGENAVPRPVTVAWPEQSSAIAREVHAALTNDKSPEEAMEDLENSLAEIEEASAE